MIDNNKLDLICNYLHDRGINFIRNELMKSHTTFKIGGPADIMISVTCETDLKDMVLMCKENDVPYIILGNGSNMLVHDEGIEGVVIQLTDEFRNLKIEDTKITCGSAVKLKDLCLAAKEKSLTGLEFAYGIPGSVGGAVFMNAGAYVAEMKDLVYSVKYMDTDGNIKEYKADELNFGYRKSIFRETKEVIVSVTFELQKGNAVEIESKMKDLLDRRKTKQPLEYPSAGSVFKRPEGQFAGTLIQQCGLKGRTVGGAQVSEKHSGFIINIGNATCDDVLSLVKIVQDTVKKETGYFLEREIVDIGK